MLHFPPNDIRAVRAANKLAWIDPPPPIRAPYRTAGIRASVVSNIEARLRYVAALNPEQFERKVREIAADIVTAVLVLSQDPPSCLEPVLDPPGGTHE